MARSIRGSSLSGQVPRCPPGRVGRAGLPLAAGASMAWRPGRTLAGSDIDRVLENGNGTYSAPDQHFTRWTCSRALPPRRRAFVLLGPGHILIKTRFYVSPVFNSTTYEEAVREK